jgi:enoyl-CoA hydratase/carnithine racemase
MTDISSDVIQSLEGSTLRVTLNRPESRNALTFGMYERLADLCSGMRPGGEVKAIVIHGAGGKAFAAGTDMSQFRAFATPQDALDYEANIDRVLTAIECCPVPTIAAINGACTGGGAAIAAACDIRITSDTLKFGFPIARTLGNCLSAGNLARLSELMGAGRVREMIFTARLIGAAEALAIGLVTEVHAGEEALMARATELAGQMAGMAPLTLQATKEALRRNRAAVKVEDADLITQCYMSADFRTGMEAFLGKTKPEWQGK